MVSTRQAAPIEILICMPILSLVFSLFSFSPFIKSYFATYKLKMIFCGIDTKGFSFDYFGIVWPSIPILGNTSLSRSTSIHLYNTDIIKTKKIMTRMQLSIINCYTVTLQTIQNTFKTFLV